MANRAAQTSQKLAVPTIELFKGAKHYTTVIGNAVAPIPVTNLVGRKGIIVQNKHDSNTIYIGSGIPYLLEGGSRTGEVYTDDAHDKRVLQWRSSKHSNDNDEWYLVTSEGKDPALTQIRYLVYKVKGGVEVLGTKGTVNSLSAQHDWGWGDADSLTFSTVYIKTDGKEVANTPAKDYDLILGYYFQLTADNTAATGGIEIGPKDTLHFTADGSVQLWAIASAATTAVGTFEVL